MSKYQRLTEFLGAAEEEEVAFSFAQLEELLGFQLPDSARQYQAWWANQLRGQSLAWQLAGWKTTALDLNRERVTFKYVAGDSVDNVPVMPDVDAPRDVKPISIADAKVRLGATFGVDPDRIDITIRA